MLRMRLHRATRGSWARQGSYWIAGDTWVEPYDHPAVESFAFHEGQRAALVVRERVAGEPGQDSHSSQPVHPGEYDRELREAAAWSGAFHIIERGPGRVRVQAGERATAPIFVASDAEVLHGDWDVMALRRRIPSPKIDTAEVGRLLARDLRYTHRTAWEGVLMLTERATSVLDASGHRIVWPEPCQYDSDRPLAANAPVVEAYEQLLSAVLQDR